MGFFILNISGLEMRYLSKEGEIVTFLEIYSQQCFRVRMFKTVVS
jgi:hypothetical protein